MHENEEDNKKNLKEMVGTKNFKRTKELPTKCRKRETAKHLKEMQNGAGRMHENEENNKKI